MAQLLLGLLSAATDRTFWLLLVALVYVPAAVVYWLPATVVSRQGVRRLFRRRVPWADVVAVPEPSRWDDFAKLQLRDGRVVTLERVPQSKAAALRELVQRYRDTPS